MSRKLGQERKGRLVLSALLSSLKWAAVHTILRVTHDLKNFILANEFLHLLDDVC